MGQENNTFCCCRRNKKEEELENKSNDNSELNENPIDLMNIKNLKSYVKHKNNSLLKQIIKF